jgi:hypothetical protein
LTSIDVPTGKPAARRPSVMQSSMANSSATRSAGEYRASVLPSTRIAELFGVRRASAAAIRFGEAMKP